MFKYRRLKDLREDRDYTQDYIADILKARRSSYANWENGETLIPLDKLDQLSVFYNVPISYLLGIKNNYNRYKNIGKMNYNLMLDKLNQLKDNLSLTYQEIGDYLKVSKSNTVSSKIVSSGIKSTRVPVCSIGHSPTTFRGYITCPLS